MALNTGRNGDLSIHPPPIPKGRGERSLRKKQTNKYRSTSSARKRTRHIFRRLKKKSFLWLAHRPSRSLIFLQQKHSVLYSYTLVYGYLHTVNCTVCLRIKYGYKAAEAVPTSPPVTIASRSKLRGDRGTVGEREAEGAREQGR